MFCLKFLCDVKLIMPLLIFKFLVEIWSENRISMPTNFGIAYFWVFGVAKHQEGDEAEARGTDEQPLSDKPPLIQCGEA